MTPTRASFIDSNVILYVASADARKAAAAEQVLAQGGIVSVQVLNEIAHIARRKMGMTWAEVRAFLDPVRRLCSVTPLDAATHDCGLRIAERYSISLFDSMIVAAALLADCSTLYSEVMQDGLLIEAQLRIINPFKV